MGKKIGLFFIFALALVGSLALLAYLLINRAWVFVPFLLVICVLAYPKVRQIYDYITQR